MQYFVVALHCKNNIRRSVWTIRETCSIPSLIPLADRAAGVDTVVGGALFLVPFLG